MPLKQSFERSRRWMDTSIELIDDLQFQSTPSTVTATALLHMAIEHRNGIHVLVQHGLLSSAHALLRPQFEAFVRGVWFHRCANDRQINDFIAGGDPPRINDILVQIEALSDIDGTALFEIKKKVWKTMNDYTHGGANQVTAKIQSDRIDAGYSEQEVCDLLDYSALLATICCLALVDATGNHLRAEVIGKCHVTMPSTLERPNHFRNHTD